MSLAISWLIRETPSLRARDHVKYANLEQTLADALSLWVHDENGRFRARLLALIGIGVLRIGADGWDAKCKPDPSELRAYTKQVFRAVWAELREFGSAGKKR